MSRRVIYHLLIGLGIVLLLASITYWLDINTSEKPVGLGQNILGWATVVADILTWLAAYLVNKKGDSKIPESKTPHISPLPPVDNSSRTVQITNGTYIENIEKVEKLEINIAQESEDTIEKNKRKYELRNKHEFAAPTVYKTIQETAIEFQEKLQELEGGYISVLGPPGSGKSTFLTQTLRTLPVRSVRYYAYVPDAQDPSVLRGESINFFHDTTLQIQRLRNSNEKRPDPTDRIALNEFFYQQLSLLGKDYEETKTKTIILIDGLDHIAREQHPERSLIEDLPLPTTIPSGVYLILGSQTKDLPDLPVGVQNMLSKEKHIIRIGRLSPQNVFEIIHQTLPEISNSFDQKIYQLVDGHPLSLIYLLNSLFLSESPDEYAEILDGTIAYSGNIEDQYFSHWRKIENDLDFSHFLGLLARIRGPIPIKWIAEWSIATDSLLLKLQRTFGQYFLEDSLGRWEFFHNSFRIFLVVRTVDNLPGRASEQRNQDIHLKLAQLYEKSGDPFRWETLYHYYKAGEHKRVIEVAQYDWFRSQVEALRPIDAIETDVRLAVKSAGELLDPIGLMRYTLVGASLQQRSNALEDSQLPNLLIETGRSDLAIDYARDGARLRLKKDKMALSLARSLYDVNKQEAVRIFELAEPLEYLSGRLISRQNALHQDLDDLLSEWVDSASLMRSPIETVQIVRRIQIEPYLNDKKNDIAQSSLNLQNRLLHDGALYCCEREDWDGWNAFFEAMDEQRDKGTRYHTLLRTIEYLRRIDENDHAKEQLLKLIKLEEPKSFGSGRNKTSNILSIVEAIYFLGIEDHKAIAQSWLNRVNIVPLSDGDISTNDNLPKLINLHFRYARMRFVLNQSISPEQLVKEAEERTTFKEYDDSDTRLARRQIALIAYTLAKSWVEGHLNNIEESDVFIRKVKWIFDLMELGWQGSSATFRLQTEGVKEDISKYLVVCAMKHGNSTLQAIKDVFSLRWENGSNVWWAGLQRNIVLSVTEYDIDFAWAKNELERIEVFMLEGLDVYSRVTECESQAEAWLQIGEREKAFSSLSKLVKCARGIYSDKDYQLTQWANWIRKTNLSLDNTASISVIKKFIRQAFSVEETTSGVDDALVVMFQAMFDISPHKALLLYKNLLEQKSITYDESLIGLLVCSLNSDNPPFVEISYIIENLLFPFTRTASGGLVSSFIAKANLILGAEVALEFSERFVERIKADVLENHRHGWVDDICNGLRNAGISPDSIEIPQDLGRDVSSNSSSDYRLHLITGEQLTLQEATSAVLTVDDLRSLIANEEKQSLNFFRWHELANGLLKKVKEIEQIEEICKLMESRIDSHSETYLVNVYVGTSKRLQELGYIDTSKKFIRKALNLSNPSGWSAYYDGGIKYDAMHQMLSVFGSSARDEIARLYAGDLSERYRYPEQLIRDFSDIAHVLFEDIPYLKIWPDVEAYLDELFNEILIEPQPDLESILDDSTERQNDDSRSALAELLMLFLDFPAYPVFNNAIQACSRLFLAGNSVVKDALHQALAKHDQLVINGLVALEVVSLHKPSEISSFQKELSDLQNSPNIIIRIIATKILINSSGQSSFPPKLERSLPAIYMLHLPDIAQHKTEYSLEQDGKSVLLRDPALVLQPLDIEARKIAQNAGVPENNLLYHAVEKLKDIEIQRTWLFNDLALEPAELSAFLEKINLRISHNKPKIFPCKNSIGHIAAELYDANKLSFSDLPFLDFVFRDHDPTLFLVDAKPRPDYIERAGGLSDDLGIYLDLPKDWDKTLENSLPLLKSHSSDRRLILAEWTHLKRLQREWPSEERISLSRAIPPYKIWDDIDLSQDHLPFANTVRFYAKDYLDLTQHPARELVIAHNGYNYQMEKANWLALNPKVGFDLGWKPVDKGLFSWKDKNNNIVVESIYWQDGNFDFYNPYERVEVGYGWVVLITEEGYQEIRRHYGVISRGGVIRRSSGVFGVNRNTISSVLDTV